jgi:hypothetical protein
MSNSRLVLRHVSTVAILLILQGACDLAFGLALCGLAVVGAGALPRDALPLESRAAAIVFGPALLATAGLKIWAGIRNHQYRSRLAGIVALASCVLSLANCLCTPLALPLLVWGLVVYRHPEAERAFLMGEQGLSREWIQASRRK